MLVSFDPNMLYKITNNCCSPSTPLEIVNDNGPNSCGALKMAAWGLRGHSGQFWQFRPGKDGTYKLCTMFLGTSKCIDVHGDDKMRPHLAVEGKYEGQDWRIMPYFEDGTWDGTYELWNCYSGQDLVMDTEESPRKLFMGERNHAGMHWIIKPIEPITSGEHWME